MEIILYTIVTIALIALLVLLIFIAIKWIAFPIQVSDKLDALISEVKRTNELLESGKETETRVIEMPPPTDASQS